MKHDPQPTEGPEHETYDIAEWVGYRNGLERALNMKPRVPRGDEGSRVLNDIRDQILAEIKRVEFMFHAR